MFCTSDSGLVIGAWRGDELWRGQARGWRTNTHTHILTRTHTHRRGWQQYPKAKAGKKKPCYGCSLGVRDSVWNPIPARIIQLGGLGLGLLQIQFLHCSLYFPHLAMVSTQLSPIWLALPQGSHMNCDMGYNFAISIFFITNWFTNGAFATACISNCIIIALISTVVKLNRRWSC